MSFILAPDMKIYCFYGIGTPTERSYYYAVTDEIIEEDCPGVTNGTGCTHIHQSEHQTKSSTAEKIVHSIKHPNLVREKRKYLFFTLHLNFLSSILMPM